MTRSLPAQAEDELTEWEHNGWLLHRVSVDYFQLFDPECRAGTPINWLSYCGITGDWLAETEQVGQVRVIHLHRPGC